MDELTASNLEDTLRLEKKRASTTEEDWDKMNHSECVLIRSFWHKTSSIMCCMRHLRGCGRSWRRSIWRKV